MSILKPISKSAFIKAEQCLKYFYLYKNHYYLRDALSKEKQLIFKRGIDVGIYAQQLFPGGVDMTGEGHKDMSLLASKTREEIEKGTPIIYEATFIYDNLLVMLDILVKQDNKWYAYEVKSSVKISETYVKDACFQYYVVKNSLQGLEDFSLLTINSNYVLDGEVDVQQLFRKTSIKSDAEKNWNYFEHKVHVAKNTLDQQKIPDVKIGPHCFSPYECEFIGTCWKNENNKESVFNLGKISKQELFDFYNNGQASILNIDSNGIEKPLLKMQIEATQKKKEHVEGLKIKKLLDRVKGKVCSVDIEVWTPAIPVYQKTRPFEQIPFLYSLSSFQQDGSVYTQHFIKEISEDGRREFIQSLLKATAEFDTILMYDRTLEDMLLNKCSELYSEYKTEIMNLKHKIVDFFELIDTGAYYHPDMKGNFSLKSLSTIVDPSCDFNQLFIQSGIVAMYTYESLLEQTNPFDIEETKQKLIDYCNLDAKITLRLLEFFRDKV